MNVGILSFAVWERHAPQSHAGRMLIEDARMTYNDE
jgi:hypothetical protein